MQNVLDSLIPALLKDENRKFIYVEQVNIAFIIVTCNFLIRQKMCWLWQAWLLKLRDKKQCASISDHTVVCASIFGLAELLGPCYADSEI